MRRKPSRLFTTRPLPLCLSNDIGVQLRVPEGGAKRRPTATDSCNALLGGDTALAHSVNHEVVTVRSEGVRDATENPIKEGTRR